MFINFLKRNKLLSILIVTTIIVFLFGILSPTLINESDKKTIEENITKIIVNYSSNKLNLVNMFRTNLSSNIILLLIIWLFGISIFGSVFILLIYLFKVYILGFDLISLLINLKLSNIIFIILYQVPNFFNILIYFILTWYGISYSICLFKFIFMKKEYNIKTITRRYIKVLLVCLLFILLSCIIESFVCSKLIGILFK